MPPFDADGKPFPTRSGNGHLLWQRQLAEAAHRAAEELATEDQPQLRQLLADLRELEARLTDADTEPPEAADPRA